MLETEVLVVGGGMAGSTVAAMLGRAGISAILVDPHPSYPADFRCEKMDDSQIALLRRTGLAESVLPAMTPSPGLAVARYGRVVDRRTTLQHCAPYETMVNAMRAAIGGSATVVTGKVAALRTGDDRQYARLAGGEEIAARLVVLANGLNLALGKGLGIERHYLSMCHSISIGFDVESRRGGFDFGALTYYPERIAAKVAYLALFPFGSTKRANLFVYRDIRDPWLAAFRSDPAPALAAALPGLERLTGPFAVEGPVDIRPVDLYRTDGPAQGGIVLVGDAFGTSCPAAGTGFNKALTDAERLCNAHIPQWLATPGMAAAKIAGFYADPEKVACDRWSIERAFQGRADAIAPGLVGHAKRRAKFVAQLGIGMLRSAAKPLPATIAGGAHQ